MMIDFSERECNTCFRCRTQEPPPPPPSHVVIASSSSSSTSVPVSFGGPVQAIGHEANDVFGVSTSTLSPSPVVTTCVSSGPEPAGQSSAAPTSQASVFGYTPFSAPFNSAPTQSLGQTTSCFDAFSSQTTPSFVSMQAPVQSSTTSSTPSSSPAFTFSPPQDFGNTASPSLFGKVVSSSSNFFGQNPSTNTTPVNVSSVFGPSQQFPKTWGSVSASSCLPGLGVGYLPGSPINPFRQNPTASSPHVSVPAGNGIVTSSPQPLGFTAAATAPISSIYSNIGPRVCASLGCSHRAEQGCISPLLAYKATPVTPVTPVDPGMVISISASMPYQYQSHEELRWENYKQGNKGSSRANPSTRILASQDRPQGNINYSPFGQPNAAFSCFSNPNRSSFASPHNTLFASDCKSPVSSEGDVPKPLFNERAPETIVVNSSTSSGCTVCGAKTSSSPCLNCATTPPPPPSAAAVTATSSAAMFYPVLGSYPLMFATTLAGQGAALAGQGASPGIHQAYPLVQCYILLPFGAMSLQ